MKRLVSLMLLILLVMTAFAGCASGGADTADNGKYGNETPGGVGDVSTEILEALANSGTVSVYQYGDAATEIDAMSGQNDGKDFTQYFEQVYGGKVDHIFKEWSGRAGIRV